ncbi:radical SAM protein [Saccharopolyspora hattusasensis]|uniref:radical SAM protein n=1 Tax=Saccharopolyspora hattusasensis TaxID=1128679 RepID=UPI003D9984BC
MRTFVPLLSKEKIDQLPERAREVVEYRKSGLSLNHIQGCPADCSYCIRHTYGMWDQRTPMALMSDAEAVEALVGHGYFQPHVTPIQIFNRATDPFLPKVKHHLCAVLEDLDARGLTNHVLVITRYPVLPEDCDRLNKLRNVKLTMLFTYSGIDDRRVEPINSDIAASSLRLAYEKADRYRTVLYWRPLVPGLNDTDEHLSTAVELSRSAHATVFTGLFYRNEIQQYFRDNGIPEPYEDTARRKIVPETLEQRVLAAFRDGDGGALFRKTSCAVAYGWNVPDYNGHYGIRDLCDICPVQQLNLCASAHQVPTEETIRATAAHLPNKEHCDIVEITERAAVLRGLDEQPRYYLQHALGFQMHDQRHPHRLQLHGRADTGWADRND